MMFKKVPNRPWSLIALAIVMALGLALSACNALFSAQGGTESAVEVRVIHWHREGGIAGFCDDVYVYNSGLVSVVNCRTTNPTVVAELHLEAEEQATVERWQASFQSWTHEQSDPAAADGLSVTLDFIGRGDKPVDMATLQQMDSLVQSALAQASR